jgi:hypothetical protein
MSGSCGLHGLLLVEQSWDAGALTGKLFLTVWMYRCYCHHAD